MLAAAVTNARLFRLSRIWLLALLACALLPGSVMSGPNGLAGAQAGEIERRGWLSILVGDAPPGAGQPPVIEYMLTDGYGLVARLVIDHETALALAGTYVTVTGRLSETTAPGSGVEVIEVTSVMAAEAGVFALPEAQNVTGSFPWVTLLCRFADDPDVPHPPDWYTALMGSDYPGMDHYWREISYNQIDLSGSITAGWYDLPQAKAYYAQPNGIIDWNRTLNDCTAAADADVYFPDFYGINLFFSSTLDARAWGVDGWGVSRDGQEKTYAVTWIPSVWASHYGVAHEMAHGFGLPHSAGPTGATYTSQWDIVSLSGCRVYHPDFGCVGSGTISFNLDHYLGWIPEERKLLVPPGTEQIFSLERLNQPQGPGYLMAQIPISDSETRFYTLETRLFSGYDQNIPGEGVVIHHVDTERRDPSGLPGAPAWVVDGDGNNDGNDDGAWWIPGEVFLDPVNNIEVAILGAEGSAFTVRVRNNAPPSGQTLVFAPAQDAHVNAAAPDRVYGTATSLRVRGVSSPIYNSYLKFDVVGINAPVQRATLRLFASDGSASGGSVFAVSNHYLDTDTPWLETGLNWNNAPAIGDIPLATFPAPVANNTWIEFDVTAAITGDGAYSFALTSDTSNSLLINSREASENPPELVIETSAETAGSPTPETTETPPEATPEMTGEAPVDELPPVTPFEPDPATEVVEAEGDRVVRTAGWVVMNLPEGASGGAYAINTAVDDVIVLPFVGMRVEVAYVQGPAFGNFTILVDGQPVQAVSSHHAEFLFGARASISGLSDGAHELRVIPEAGHVIGIDAFAIALAAPAAPADESTPEVAIEVTEPVAPTLGAQPPEMELTGEVSAPVETPWPTATPSQMPTLLPPVPLPVTATMEEGQENWVATAGWSLTADAAYGGSALGWRAVAASPNAETLTWLQLIDLSTARQPQLSFQSHMQAGNDAGGAVQVMGASGIWDTVAIILPGADWQTQLVDLSRFAGQVIQLRFIWLAVPLADGVPSGEWRIDLLMLRDLLADEAPVPPPVDELTPLPATAVPDQNEPPAETASPPVDTALPVIPTPEETETAMASPPPTEPPAAEETATPE